MVRFSDLEKKGAAKEAEPESSVFEDLSEEESPPLDANAWHQRACRFVEDEFHCLINLSVSRILLIHAAPSPE